MAIFKTTYKRWNETTATFDDFLLSTSADLIAETTTLKVLTAAERTNISSLASLTLGNKAINTVLAGPASGSAGAATFRSLVSDDIPSLASIYLPLTGGALSGALTVATINAPTLTAFNLNGTANVYINAGPTNNSIFLIPTGSGTVNVGGKKITNLAAPTADTDAATKLYVDTEIDTLEGMITTGTKPASGGPVVAATTANITLSGLQTIDGITVTAGQRVLVKNQTTVADNGIYTASATAWSKVTADSVKGILVFVEGGSTQNDYLYHNNDGNSWVVFSRVDTVTASTGLTKVGVDIRVASSGITNAMLAGSIATSKLDSIPASYWQDALAWTSLAAYDSTNSWAATLSSLFSAIKNLRGTPSYSTNNTQTIDELYRGSIAEVGAVAKATSTVNVSSLSGPQTVDGVACSAGDLVLLVNQTTTSQNGLYLVNASAWTKIASHVHGHYTATQGTNAGKYYVCNTATAFALLYSAPANYPAGLSIFSILAPAA